MLHRQWVEEVASFQSVCNDARIRFEHTLSASYALCTALDEAASDALFNGMQAQIADCNPWLERSLAVRFHGDGQGGSKVFRLVGRVVFEHRTHIDLLELMYIILRLGFEGEYRYAADGRRELENMRRQIHSIVNTGRQSGPPHLLAHWQEVERAIQKPHLAATLERR